MTAEALSRFQFALTISFHFVFPPLTIGLGLVLVIIQTLRVRTGKPLYLELARFWTKVFGLVFAIGVATGIPMEFQFGTNWAHYARFVGDIFGSPLAIEGIYAFFMESGFLALLLFGWNKIGPRMHLFSTCMVALGAHFSAIWIVVANSWMQTPAGYHLARMVKVTADGQQFPMTADLTNVTFTLKEIPLPVGYIVQPADLGYVRAVVDNFHDAIFNPSTIVRLSHTILACWITGAFMVASIGAWWLLRGRHLDYARVSLKIGIAVATVACLLQMVAADATARSVARHQPTKLAAMEGLQESRKEAPLSIVGWVHWTRDANGQIIGVEEKAIRLPGLLSILVSGDFLHPARGSETRVQGLTELPRQELLRARYPDASEAELAKLRPKYWPNAPVVFQMFHLMVLLGVTMTTGALLSCWWWKTGKLWNLQLKATRVLLGFLVMGPFLAEVATQAGWFTTELGRQPWIVYEVLKTGEAVSPVIRPPQVLTSIVLFFLIYVFLTILFVSLLNQKIKHGPEAVKDGEPQLKEPEPFTLRTGKMEK